MVKLVLFGSRARGDTHEESDWDIAVFLTNDPTIEDRHRLSDLGSDVLMDMGEVIQPMVLPSHREGEDSHLLREIRAGGIVL